MMTLELNKSVKTILNNTQHLWPSDLSTASPTVWNFLPDFIRNLAISADCFRHLCKTNYCSVPVHSVHCEFVDDNCAI